MTDLQPEETTEPSENERFYDEVLAPQLASLANQAMERGMGFVACVEYDQGATGTTSINIGPDSGIGIQLVHVISLCRGNIDLFFMQCMKRFDMSQTLVGSFINRMKAEDDLARARKEASNG